jgi:Flp pilus assembly protein protease CpaA
MALFILGIPICIADCSTFIIPNIYNKILGFVTSMYLVIYGFGDLTHIVISFLILLLLFLVRIGMGDIKLLALVLLTHSFNAVDFLGYVLVLAMVHIVVLAGINRNIPSKIPLAPSIFIGLSTYLATR